ncbi:MULTISPECIES: copper resistance protein CopC [Bacillaceae]|jgi:copper resistance protein C|uniref:copper resistance CopC family protein n=1 Tax=Bacillaceae TaxID=186817 RepID=UPI0021D87D32|nr:MULTISPECIES: copper resistance protein CopC [Bacillaceae]MCU9599865.1 copper resistance protein CopC [Pallidibacillus thermolactis subsp. kokeshiiformis]MED3645136.1 copper resistance protein CopC [Caldifermentibacillus hisashii]MED4475730.1 copper resistance protein CopC [Oceanobacillus caeni]
MGKRLLLLLVFVFSISSNQVLAHTSLEDSTPKDGQVITEPIQELILIFGTKIEQSSNLKVSSLNGDSVELQDIVIEHDTMKASLAEPLQNGSYQVDWQIIGADGHPIQGIISFSVDMPSNEQLDDEFMENEEKLKQVEEVPKPTPKQQKREVEQNNIPSYVIPIITGLLFVIVVFSFIWLMRRGKK